MSKIFSKYSWGGEMKLKRVISVLCLCLLESGCAMFFCQAGPAVQPSTFGSPNSDHLVIFIHGLCGDAKETWTNENTGFVFPKQLSEDLQDTYVVSFDYVSKLGESPNIGSVANHLEFEIDELFKAHEYRTIRFIAHSMGGIVAREYVLSQRFYSNRPQNVTHLVLLAAPVNGSDLAKLSFFTRANRQVEELKHVDRGNSYLEALNKKWNRAFKAEGHPHYILTYAGYEELSVPIPFIGEFIGRVVEPSSAIAYADDSMGFPKDHFGMAKPQDSQDDLYRWVKAQLQKSPAAQPLREELRPRIGFWEEGSSFVPLPSLRARELAADISPAKADSYELALKAIAERKFDDAQQFLKEAEETSQTEPVKIKLARGQIEEFEGRYPQAVNWYQGALGIEKEHPDTLTQTALALYLVGKYADAESLYKQALAIEEKTIGSEHPDVTISLNGLGMVYRTLARFSEAEREYRRALAIAEKSLGPEDPIVAISLSALGDLYRAQGKYEAAEPLYRRALAIAEKSLGPENPNVTTSLNALGNLYRAQGKYEAAEPLYKRALAIAEKSLGPEDPTVAISLNALAGLYLAQARDQPKYYIDAEHLYEQALKIREKALGHDHPGVANSLNNLGTLYYSQRSFAKAESLFQRALAIREKVLGREHPEVAIILHNLAGLYQSRDMYGKAELLFKRALAINEKGLGKEHPAVAASLHDLAGIYHSQGLYEEAVTLEDRAEKIRLKHDQENQKQ